MVKRMIDQQLLAALREAGIADAETRRVVIDIKTGELPIVYIEKYGEDGLIKVAEALAGVEIEKR